MPDVAPILAMSRTPLSSAIPSIATGHAWKLSETTPTVIRAWLVEVKDVAITSGQDVTIIANQVVFSGDGAAINTSGGDAATTYVSGNKPVMPQQPGQPGVAGQPGGDGKNAGKVAIYASQITGTVRVKAHGGAGARGQDGGDGFAGSPGPTVQGPDCNLGQPCIPPPGPPGQQGGDGGMAGAPGKSGNGGNLDIWVPANHGPLKLDCDLSGGAAPEAAEPGTPALGGLGGFNTRNETVPVGGPGPTLRMRLIPHTGAQGPSLQGNPAPSQPLLPAAGANGLLHEERQPPRNAAPHQLTDTDLSGNCSVQQLWSIAQTAETAYLNDELPIAGPRLMWVAAVAKLMGARA